MGGVCARQVNSQLHGHLQFVDAVRSVCTPESEGGMGGIGDEWMTEAPATVWGVNRVAVVGSGTMGLGIAEAAARAGIETVIIKATGGDPDGARQHHQARVDQQVERGK